MVSGTYLALGRHWPVGACPSPLHIHPCPHQIPSDLSAFGWHLEDHGYHGNSWAAQLLVPVHPTRSLSTPTPSPAQLPQLPSQRDWVRLSQPFLLQLTSCHGESFKGLRARWAKWAFLSQHRLSFSPASRDSALLCPRPLEPTWVSFTLSLESQAKPGLAFRELCLCNSCLPSRPCLLRAFAQQILSLDPLTWTGWVRVKGMSRALRSGRH